MKLIYPFLVLATSIASAQIINFPDANLKTKLLSADVSNDVARNLTYDPVVIDTNSDGEIDSSEAQAVAYLDLSSANIASLEGILHFTQLVELNVNSNELTQLSTAGLTQLRSLNCGDNLITELIVTPSPSLFGIDCSGNSITQLDLTGLTQLGSIICTNNDLTSLDLSNKPQLGSVTALNNHISNLNLTGSDSIGELTVGNNELTNLDLTGKNQLYFLCCYGNHLQQLDFTGLTTLHEVQAWENELTQVITTGATNIAYLYVSSSHLSAIDVSGLPALYLLMVDYNELTSLDVSHNPNLTIFSCTNNNLLSMNIANGNNNSVYFASNPNLQYICVDPNESDRISMAVVENGNAMCVVSTLCSGQNTYTLQGDIKIDSDSNGCTPTDAAFPNLTLNLLSTSGGGTVIANAQGHYTIPAGAATYQINPVLSTPYYTIEPASVTVNLPADSGIASFCMIPTGVHEDLEITILPIVAARPGFDATYKILCRNVGTTQASGNVTFTFPDATSDFITASPNASSQSAGVLNWTYSALQPFEVLELTVTLNINSPQETPPVNAGHVLALSASVASAQADETPGNNTFDYSEVVAGSFDPNDKRCIEGSIVGTEVIGEFVHYMIRFENTGTAPASNVIVSDRIAADKFDLASLVPLSASHPFTTKISNGNKVEFIFENINLPFNDADDDGYVAFKIRIRSSLVAGNSFSNSASIYFDYNYPVTTNEATTLIQSLGDHDFELSDPVTFYPNPAATILNIAADSVVIGSVEVYNLLGQLLFVKAGINPASIDVSLLAAGNYVAKIKTDKGIVTGRFVKK